MLGRRRFFGLLGALPFAGVAASLVRCATGRGDDLAVKANDCIHGPVLLELKDIGIVVYHGRVSTLDQYDPENLNPNALMGVPGRDSAQQFQMLASAYENGVYHKNKLEWRTVTPSWLMTGVDVNPGSVSGSLESQRKLYEILKAQFEPSSGGCSDG